MPDVLFMQETHLVQSKQQEALTWLRRHGYKAVHHPAVANAAGTGSAGGVAVAVRAHIGMVPLELPSVDIMAGRWAACKISGVMAGGIACISCYLRVDHTKEELVHELAALLEWTRSLQIPFVIAGDFNATAEQIAQTGFLEATNAVLLKSRENTCLVGEGSVIDFFLVHVTLCNRRHSVALYDGSVTRPHVAVRLQMQGRRQGDTVRVRRLRKTLPESMPPTCCPYIEDPVWPWEDAGDINDLEQAWTVWSQHAEEYILKLLQLDSASPAWKGRGAGVQYRTMSLSKHACSVMPPKTSKEVRAWRRLQVICGRLMSMLMTGATIQSVTQWVGRVLTGAWCDVLGRFVLQRRWHTGESVLWEMVWVTPQERSMLMARIAERVQAEMNADGKRASASWRAWAGRAVAGSG
eukprot:6476289-Amphidinium_carterae.3